MNTIFNSFTQRVLAKAAFGAAMLGCALASAICVAGAGGGAGDADRAAPTLASELPRTWQGVPVRPLALSAVEQRFADRFPGSIARLTDGRQIVVLREVAQPTRMLHPAADCFRALGYRIEGERLELAARANAPATAPRAQPAQRNDTAAPLLQTVALRVTNRLSPGNVGDALGDAWGDTPHVSSGAMQTAAPGDGQVLAATRPASTTPNLQRCFTARKGDVALRVCEQIEDAHGQCFADTSAWYWAAALGRSTGPWRAVTVTQPLARGDV